MASNNPSDEVHRIQNQIDIETKIKDGAENLLSVFDLKLATNTKHDLRRQIESELDSANANIASLTSELQRWRQIHADTQSPHLSNYANYASDAISALPSPPRPPPPAGKYPTPPYPASSSRLSVTTVSPSSPTAMLHPRLRQQPSTTTPTTS